MFVCFYITYIYIMYIYNVCVYAYNYHIIKCVCVFAGNNRKGLRKIFIIIFHNNRASSSPFRPVVILSLIQFNVDNVDFV